MAKIYNDKIVCDEYDPYIAVQVPDQLKFWIECAARTRGTTIQDLLIEFLYDHFHYSIPADASWENPYTTEVNAAERLRRDYLVYLRWSTYGKLRCGWVGGSRKRMAAEQWAMYEELRSKNFEKVYEATRYKCMYNRRRANRTPEEKADLKNLYPKEVTVALTDTGKVMIDNRSGKVLAQGSKGSLGQIRKAIREGRPRSEIEALRKKVLAKTTADRQAKDRAKGGRKHCKTDGSRADNFASATHQHAAPLAKLLNNPTD